MLKLHDFQCTSCGEFREELIDVPPGLAHIHCPKCRSVMEHVVIGGKAHVFKPFWHEHLDHKPVLIDSWKTYKRELVSRGLSNSLGS